MGKRIATTLDYPSRIYTWGMSHKSRIKSTGVLKDSTHQHLVVNVDGVLYISSSGYVAAWPDQYMEHSYNGIPADSSAIDATRPIYLPNKECRKYRLDEVVEYKMGD